MPRPRRPHPAEARAALAVLLTGRDQADDPVVDHFLGYVRYQGLPIDHLWQLERAGRPVCAAISLPAPGAAAMVMVTPPEGPHGFDDAMACVAAALADTPVAHRKLIQVLLDPEQSREARLFEQSGFERLATLAYLQRDLKRDLRGEPPGDAAPPWPAGALLDAEAAGDDLIGEAIAQSYIDTRDCPRLVGSRTMPEVVAGHRGTGTYDPATWWVLRLDGAVAGSVLVNRLQETGHHELVYLGVSPDFRGRGLGAALLDHALASVGQRGGRSMFCAVDQQNLPAVRLYRSRGFTTHTRKVAWVRLGG